MTEIKPVYRGKLFEDTAWVYMDSKPKERESYLIIETLYPAAAYEALQKENEAALEEINRLVSLNDKFHENENRLISENAAQAKRIAELENDLVEFNEFKKIRDSKMQELRKQMP